MCREPYIPKAVRLAHLEKHEQSEQGIYFCPDLQHLREKCDEERNNPSTRLVAAERVRLNLSSVRFAGASPFSARNRRLRAKTV